MKPALASSLLALVVSLAATHALAAEGKVSSLEPMRLDTQRVSNYVGTARAGSKRLAQSARKPHADEPKLKIQTRAKRPAVVEKSGRASHIYFRNASGRLITDRDGDGYHSEFRIRFDADSSVGDVLVYARLYLRRLGEPDWLLYHTTDDFWLDGLSGSDDYYVTTTLDDGFATGEYDVLIDLYEVGYSDIVATISAYDTNELAYLPLEEVGLDVPIELPGYSIRGVETLLLIDSDRDGHYSRFEIAFDPDADFDGTYVYASVWVRAQGGEWIEEHVSEDFLVDASGEDDLYVLTIDWISGYPTSFYDVQIDLYDSATGALVASAGSERPELAQIPLEDQQRDARVNPPIAGPGGNATSRERGGGAFNPWWLLAFTLLAAGRFTIRRSRT